MASLLSELPKLCLTDQNRQQKVIDCVSSLVILDNAQKKIQDIFIDEMALGLAENPTRKSSLLMENTFVPKLPDGNEHGRYLSLDLGSTNFRVIMVTYDKGVLTNELVDHYHIPDATRLGPGVELFDFLASCISDFLKKHNIEANGMKLGFCFSFPMHNKAINVGILSKWTKSFDCAGVEGNDAAKMLNEAIGRAKLNINVNCILNDTTGTLVQGAYIDPRCAMGIIFGTGNNGAYIEKTENIEKFKGKTNETHVIIDIEWGAFGDNGVIDFVRTEWDDKVDQQSLFPKSFTFEKYVGGKFLGDIVREVLLSLAEEGLFGNGVPEKLKTFQSLSANHVGDIEKDFFAGKSETTKSILEEMGVSCNDNDIKVVQYVTGLVSYRAVHLVALLSGILLNRMDRAHSTIAIDGSLFKHHPRFRPLMEKLCTDLAPGKQFSLLLASDGSGKGAAMTAAIAERITG